MIKLYIAEDSKDSISQQCSKIVYFCWHMKVGHIRESRKESDFGHRSLAQRTT